MRKSLVLTALAMVAATMAPATSAHAEEEDLPSCAYVIVIGPNWRTTIQTNYANFTLQWGYQASGAAYNQPGTSNFVADVQINTWHQNGLQPKVGISPRYLYHSSIGNPYAVSGSALRLSLKRGDIVTIRVGQTFSSGYAPIASTASCII